MAWKTLAEALEGAIARALECDGETGIAVPTVSRKKEGRHLRDPRKFTVEPSGGLTVCLGRVFNSEEAAEPVLLPVHADRSTIAAIPSFEVHALRQHPSCGGATVLGVLATSCQSKIGNPVIVSDTIDVIDDPIGEMAVDEEPGEPVGLIGATRKLDRHVASCIGTTGHGADIVSVPGVRRPDEDARSGIVRQVVADAVKRSRDVVAVSAHLDTPASALEGTLPGAPGESLNANKGHTLRYGRMEAEFPQLGGHAPARSMRQYLRVIEGGRRGMPGEEEREHSPASFARARKGQRASNSLKLVVW